MAAPPRVTFYTRSGCCLCEDALQVLQKARRRVEFNIEKVDIDQHPEMRSLYNDEVPVIAIDGKKAFKYHVDLDEFLRRLAARA